MQQFHLKWKANFFKKTSSIDFFFFYKNARLKMLYA